LLLVGVGIVIAPINVLPAAGVRLAWENVLMTRNVLVVLVVHRITNVRTVKSVKVDNVNLHIFRIALHRRHNVIFMIIILALI
jgi:hypothetical protein